MRHLMCAADHDVPLHSFVAAKSIVERTPNSRSLPCTQRFVLPKVVNKCTRSIEQDAIVGRQRAVELEYTRMTMSAW